MKKLISISILSIFIFSGCARNYKKVNTPERISPAKKLLKKKKDIQEIAKIPKTKRQIKIPYIKESKFIKILILPFENAQNDIDYGGYIETKLEPSKFIFNKRIKNKILKDSSIVGGI